MKKFKIGIILPYAVSIRDLVHTGTINTILQDKKLDLVIYTINPDIAELKEAKSLGATIVSFKPSKDNFVEKIIKRIYRLFFSDQLENVRQELEERRSLRYIAYIALFLRNILGIKILVNITSFLLLAVFQAKRLPKQLDPEISLLIGTRSLINSLDYCLLAEASLSKMPIVTIASSWDNFTTKGFFPFNVVKTAVWNQKMKNELVDIFAVDVEKIQIVGYPRAELLRQMVSDESSEEYLKTLGVIGYRRFILYSASYSELTKIPGEQIPLEYFIIKNVCEELVTTLPDDVCILIRLHPFSDGEDVNYFSDLANCVVLAPGRQDKYVERVMNESDEWHLSNQVAKSICIISMASTISIDALSLKRPIINIFFDLKDLPFKYSIKRFYRFDHFKSLLEYAKIPLAASIADVSTFVGKSLHNDKFFYADMDSFEQMYVPRTDNNYANSILNIIKKSLNYDG